MHSFFRSSFISLSMLFLASHAVPATAQLPRFSVQDIGDLGGDCYPTDLNNQRQIVGSIGVDIPPSSHTYHPFLYSQNSLTDLYVQTNGKFAGANRINSAGIIAGTDKAGYAAILNGNTVTRLGALGNAAGPYGYSNSFGINSQGQVVGQSVTNTSDKPEAFLYSNGHMTNLNTLPNSYASAALGVNDAGVAVGWINGTRVDASGVHGFTDAVAFSNGTVQVLEEALDFQIQASAINNKNQIIGVNKNGGFLYSDGHLMTLPHISTGLSNINPLRINNRGEIVGNASGSAGAAAFYSIEGQVYNLNTLTDPATSGGILLTEALAINDLGQILALGFSPGRPGRTYLLTEEVPEPSAFAFILTASLTGTVFLRCRRKV